MPPSGTDNCIFDTVAIVGVGLIGGSLGMATRKNGLARRVIGIGRTEQNLMRAKILGAIDDYSLDMESGVSDADLIVICTPVLTIVPTLQKMLPRIRAGAIVTDAGSTKGRIADEASGLLPQGVHFIGGHPMAGTEKAGVESAFPDMFLGATYVLTPNEDADLEALGKLTAFAEGTGARVEVMTPEQHDAAVAVISHLPHAISAALLRVAEDSQKAHGKVFQLAAGSFRDLTRVSDSPVEIWRDICATNSDSLNEAISLLCTRLDEFKQALKNGDVDAIGRFFEEAAGIRQTYLRIKR